MKELYEFRIFKDNYHLLPANKAKDNGSVYVLYISKTDPLYQKIGDIDNNLRIKKGDFLFGFWCIHRSYTKSELANAALFHVKIQTAFEPTGEECGTLYDETSACPICGAHKEQISQLCLKRGSIPKKKDIARTIAGEVVVSENFVSKSTKWGIRGIQLLSTSVESYYQLACNVKMELSTKTITGINPFDLSTQQANRIYKCPNGDTIGLNLLSEVYVLNHPFINKLDFFASKQYIGSAIGVLQPEPVYLCSPKFRKMVLDEKLKGFEFEIAHIV